MTLETISNQNENDELWDMPALECGICKKENSHGGDGYYLELGIEKPSIHQMCQCDNDTLNLTPYRVLDN